MFVFLNLLLTTLKAIPLSDDSDNLPSSESEVSQFQEELERVPRDTLSTRLFNELIRMVERYNKLVRLRSPDRLRLEKMRKRINKCTRKLFPTAVGVAHAIENPSLIACNAGHLILRLKEGVAKNALFLSLEELVRLKEVLRAFDVSARTQSRDQTKTRVWYVRKSQLSATSTKNGRVKLGSNPHTFDFTANDGTADGKYAHMPFNHPFNPPLGRAVCEGRTWRGEDALTTCQAHPDHLYKTFRVMVRIFQ